MAKQQPKSAFDTKFVLDCSIVFAWYFADEADDYADAVAESMSSTTAIVPSVFHLEVANTLVVGERRKRSTEAQATAFLARLSGLPIISDEQTALRAWAEIVALARVHGLSSYDAAYLELAARLAVPLATLDDKLILAAKAVGVPQFKP